jgi:hypothetical protein
MKLEVPKPVSNCNTNNLQSIWAISSLWVVGLFQTFVVANGVSLEYYSYSVVPLTTLGAVTAQSVERLPTSWTTEGSEFESW